MLVYMIRNKNDKEKFAISYKKCGGYRISLWTKQEKGTIYQTINGAMSWIRCKPNNIRNECELVQYIMTEKGSL